MRLRHARPGFTLIESAVAVVIVGVGIVAMLGAMASGSRVNAQARETTQAIFLAQEIREWTLRLPYRDPNDPNQHSYPYTSTHEAGEDPNVFVNDLKDLNGVTYSPPRDGEGQAITGLAGWKQAITMQWRDPAWLTNAAPGGPGSSPTLCVTVVISHNNQPVYTASWIVTQT
jgi:prepilin-type N-terminal cleavage/methylation domain-containing protein